MDTNIGLWNPAPGCAESLLDRREGTHTVRITMIGGGYVGLVSGACFAEFGTDVTVMETDAAKLAALPPEAVRQTKALMKHDTQDVLGRMEAELTIFKQRLVSPEAKEAFTAWIRVHVQLNLGR